MMFYLMIALNNVLFMLLAKTVSKNTFMPHSSSLVKQHLLAVKIDPHSKKCYETLIYKQFHY